MLGNFLAAKVVLSSTSFSFDMEYTYSIPHELDKKLEVGMRVLVPFGRANKKRIGLVTRIYTKDIVDSKLKPLISVLDETTCINDEMLGLIFWLKDNTFCTYFEALSLMIPKGLGINFNVTYSLAQRHDEDLLTPQEQAFLSVLRKAQTEKQLQSLIEKHLEGKGRESIQNLVIKGFLEENNNFRRNVGDETIKMVRLSDEYQSNSISVKLSEKQNAIVSMLEECECASYKEICYLCNVTTAVIKTLISKNVLFPYDYEVLREVKSNETEHISPDDIILSPKQNEVFDGIKSKLDEHKACGALLHGVTGSGKTAVFLKLIDYVMSTGKTVIMLIPEISLTPQMVSKFRSVFGSTVAVIHSSLSLGQRVDEYKRIKSGDARIVVGTRSAVFAPLENIGLIIIDEEGERTYKSESSPRYHARDVAIKRCGYHNALLLLASATPSIESYYYAKTGRFSLFELKERYSDATLPQVVITDMQLEVQNGNNGIFSGELINRININLEKKEQTIILLNRRGFHTYISCLDCREPVVCPMCSVPMTYHKTNGMLMCHYCGYTKPLDTKCEKCGSTHLHPTGAGTQKLEDELERLFPTARVLRMDADTTNSKFAYEKNFTDFQNGKYDIMIGTQMIAKGLDFPNVTLVGVLSLDKALFLGDFRSYERTFSLITQVVGRSGRGEKKGIAIIQTFVPDHYVLELASKQDYEGFFEQEIATRKVMTYPPFCDICVIGFSSPIETQAQQAAQEYVRILKRQLDDSKEKIPIRVLGPVKCSIAKINNKFRYRIIIKCRNNHTFRDIISNTLKACAKDRLFSNTGIYADINGDIGV